MKNKNRKLLIMVFYSFIVLVIGFLSGYFIHPLIFSEPSALPLPTPTPVPDGAQVSVEAGNEETTDKGKRWKVFSDTFDYNKETSEGFLYNVTCSLYEGKEEQISIESDEATIDFEKKIIIFNTRVRAVSTKGERFQVDKLVWNYEDNLSQGEGNVRLLKEGTLVKADRIEADITLSTYDMFGNIEFIKSKERREDYIVDLLDRTAD